MIQISRIKIFTIFVTNYLVIQKLIPIQIVLIQEYIYQYIRMFYFTINKLIHVYNCEYTPSSTYFNKPYGY